MKKCIGILGGMGPEATAYLFSQIIRNTAARSDQEHIHILIDNRPAIPDRSAWILGRGEDPLPEMRRSAELLQRMGADFILIPCNAAHYFIDALQKSLRIPVVDMIAAAAESIKTQYGKGVTCGLLATQGTYHAGLYRQHFAGQGLELLVPPPQGRETIMSAIYGAAGIKAGNREQPREILIAAARGLTEQGARIIIAGCTEISFVLGEGVLDFTLACPLRILARHAVTLAGYAVEESPESGKCAFAEDQ